MSYTVTQKFVGDTNHADYTTCNNLAEFRALIFSNATDYKNRAWDAFLAAGLITGTEDKEWLFGEVNDSETFDFDTQTMTRVRTFSSEQNYLDRKTILSQGPTILNSIVFGDGSVLFTHEEILPLP